MVNEALGLPYGVTIGGDHVVVPTRRLVDVNMISFSSKKQMWQKVEVHLTSERFLKFKNT
jgi:hypothetical protein